MEYVTGTFLMGLADGPTEVHKTALAREVLRLYEADEDIFPDYHIPRLREQARTKYAAVLARHR